MEKSKKIVLSGIQPSGTPTLGNYVGMLRNSAKLQTEETYCYYFVANMHATTVRQDPEELMRRSVEVLALLLACGVDPERSALFIQSHVKEHAELAWALSCNTYIGELNRMTQFKEKSTKHADNINAGLFTYPVLMAADVLLYQTNLVPVGKDQKQHLELARNIAIRFNNAYGETFTVPEPFISSVGGRVMSLQDPLKKMSKSDANPNAYVSMMDDPSVIVKKIKRAVTDSENRIAYEPEKPGVSNLLSIYSTFTGKTTEEAVQTFSGMGYGHLKTAVADAVVAELTPVQEKYRRFAADKAHLNAIMLDGALKARNAAKKTMDAVYSRIGYLPPTL